MSAVIFTLLSIVPPEGTRTKDDEVKNGLFSMLAFIIGASTSILSGYLGMSIATFANARTALEARKGIAPAFAVGKPLLCACDRISCVPVRRLSGWGGRGQLTGTCALVFVRVSRVTAQPSALVLSWASCWPPWVC